MEEVTLRAIKRAMPGHGRARIHSSLLSAIGIEDKTEVEVFIPGGASLTLTVFADSLVEKGQIRISEDDLKKLGISDGAEVQVKRKMPIAEQVKDAAEEIAGKISQGVQDIGETLSGKTTGLKEGTRQVSQDIQEKARVVSGKIVEQIVPLGEKIEEAGKETVARIQDLVPTARFSAPVETGLKRLKPGDASDLKKILLEQSGEKHAVIVKAPTATGRTIQNLTLPPDAIIVAVQREDNSLIIPVADTVIFTGDLIYLSGNESGLEYLSKLLEG